MANSTILVIEDEEKHRRVIGLHLASLDYEVKAVGTAEDGWKLAGDADLILTDLKLPGMDGLELLEKLKGQNSRTPVIVMSAFGTVENAVEAMKRGAVDFLPKPFSLDHLSVVVEKALEVRKLRDENRELREALGHKYQFENIIGRSPAMQEIFATVERIAPTRATVLLAGESGVGKDMIARAIHQHSPRKDRPFVKINCTAIPENLMESELFGYEKGAFTGANTSKPGKFEQANTGTVMLDEIGDVPPSVQVKLLRVLQEREFERLGSNKTLTTDVRVENVVERSILLAQGPRVEAEDVKIDMGAGRTRPAVGSTDGFLPDGLTLDQYEQSIIREALKRANGNKSQAARLLGLTRNALRYRLAQMGIE
jgi:DNA-binding NtrC family response regulator